jgi:hypothetical protein
VTPANLADLASFLTKILVMLMTLLWECMVTVFKDAKFVSIKLKHVQAVLQEVEVVDSIVTTTEERSLFAVSSKRVIANMDPPADSPMMVRVAETPEVVIVIGTEVVTLIVIAITAEVEEMTVILVMEEIPEEMIHVIAEIAEEMTLVTAEIPEEMTAVTPETEKILVKMMIVVTPDVTVTMTTGRQPLPSPSPFLDISHAAEEDINVLKR